MVADKVLFSRTNLELLEREGIGYVLGFRLKLVASKLGSDKTGLYDTSVMERLSEGIYYKGYHWEGRRVIVVYSEKRAKYEIELIDRQVRWLKGRVKSGGTGVKDLLKGKSWSRFVKSSGDKVEIGEESIRKRR